MAKKASINFEGSVFLGGGGLFSCAD